MCKVSSCRCAKGERARLGGEATVNLDMNVVTEAVRLLMESEAMSTLTGYRADFALIKQDDGSYATALVEVNDGYVSGRYGARFSAEIYTRGCHWIPRMFA
jgi:hypothetical protein